MNISISKYTLVSILILVLYFLPYCIQWDNSYITIHDNLDSDVVWYSSITSSNDLFTISNSAVLPNIMNGIPRNSLPSGYTFVSLLFLLFSTYTAYFINFILIHCVAFIGMYLLLRDFIFNSTKQEFAINGISLAFALLPFYGTHPGIAISGIPLLAWCFMHFKQNSGKWYHFFLVVFFAFYSSLIYTGIFILFFLYMYVAYYWHTHVKIIRQYIIGLLLLTIGLLLSEIQVISQMLFSDFIPHRLEFSTTGLSVFGSLRESLSLLFKGQYHAPSVHGFIALLAIVFITFQLYGKKWKQTPRSILAILIIILCISLFYGFWNSRIFISIQHFLPILKIVQWHRFYWLLPVFWLVLFAVIIKHIIETSPKYRNIAFVCIIIQIIVTGISNKEVLYNYQKLVGLKTQSQKPSFKQYYDTALFTTIRDSIGMPQNAYRVISVGINPEVAIYNGFYCLDSYQRNYLLEYKHDFRKIIEPELQKDSVLQNYFDTWGSRCYIFSHELGLRYNFGKYDSIKNISDLQLNYKAAQEMGAQFLLSAVEIINNPNLSEIGVFETKESYWKIWLYQIK